MVEIENKIRAFTCGFPLSGNLFCINYEIADLKYKGLPQFIFAEFAKRLMPYREINIMEDCGFENLKKTKLSYHPSQDNYFLYSPSENMKFCAGKTFKNNKSAQELFSAFKDDRLPFLLESSLNVDGMGRYSFLGSEPFLVLSVKNGRCFIEQEGEQRVIEGSCLGILRGLLKKYELKGKNRSLIPFLCGAVGFFSYDFGFSLESIKRKNIPDPVVPEVLFGFYDTVVCLDHQNKEVTVFSSGFPQKDRHRMSRAQERLKGVLGKLKNCDVPAQKKIPAESFYQTG